MIVRHPSNRKLNQIVNNDHKRLSGISESSAQNQYLEEID
jgi:hypothetical protein